MKSAELAFDRPAALQADGPTERRGLERDEVRLLVTTARGHEHARFRDLPRFLAPGTLLVVNTSATLPASLPARHAHLGPVLANVSTDYGGGLVLVECRRSAAEPGPLPLEPGDALDIAGLPARLVAPHPGQPRLWFVRLEGDERGLRRAMLRDGAPIRYGYLEPPYPSLEAYQTLFARQPGSAEMPSAARREGRPVIAVGTTVVRALESAWDGERVRAAAGFTRLLIHPGRPARSVDGLVTGLHDPRASHLAMLFAIAPQELVHAGYQEAVRESYLWHEFGDSHLLLARTGGPETL